MLPLLTYIVPRAPSREYISSTRLGTRKKNELDIGEDVHSLDASGKGFLAVAFLKLLREKAHKRAGVDRPCQDQICRSLTKQFLGKA